MYSSICARNEPEPPLSIVVGDVEQLKPIWRVGVPQDMGFLRRTDLHTQADYLSEGGLRASTGSAMAAAQRASAYSDTDGRGITLVRHYRCRPTIIEFCNRLVYDSLRPLIPVIPEDPRRMFHPMSYVESDGRASRENGSVVNRVEADELVTWLTENQSAVEQYYNRKDGRLLRQTDEGYRDLGDLDEHERMAEEPTKSWCVCLRAGQNESRASLWVTESSAADAPGTRFADEAKARRVAEAFEATGSVQPHLQESTFTLGHAAPAGTAEILVAAWEKLGLRPGETSRILQDLYEGNRKAVSGAVGRDTGDG